MVVVVEVIVIVVVVVVMALAAVNEVGVKVVWFLKFSI